MSVDLGLVRGKGISSMTCNGNVVTVTYTDNTSGTFTISSSWASVNTGITGVTMYVNTMIRMVHFYINVTNKAMSEESSLNLGTLNDATIQYKPKTLVSTSCYNPDINVAVNEQGQVLARTITDKSGATIHAGMTWAY